MIFLNYYYHTFEKYILQKGFQLVLLCDVRKNMKLKYSEKFAKSIIEKYIKVDSIKHIGSGNHSDAFVVNDNLEEAMEEASRCINCKNAQCVKGCPVAIDIPAFIEKVKEGAIEEALTDDLFAYRVIYCFTENTITNAKNVGFCHLGL